MKRDLHADLRLCEAATVGPWETGYDHEEQRYCVEAVNEVSWGGGFIVADCAYKEDAKFIAEAREGWPHAIRRALEAEAERDELRKIVSSECPIDALDIVESLRVEKWHMQERIAELEAEIERLKAQIEEMKDEIAAWKKIALGFDKFQEGEE